MTLSREFRFITHTHVCGSPIHSLGCHPNSHVPPSWDPVLYIIVAGVRSEELARPGRAGSIFRPGPHGPSWPRCEIEPLLVASMATTLLEGLVSSALAGNELFESFFRAAGPCLLVEAWRDAGAPRAFDGTALPGWSPNAGHLLATRSPSMKCVPVVSEPSVPYCTS